MGQSSPTADGRILDGITVVDLSTYVTGGFATTMLANQGAEVIKVEPPDVGDGCRYWGPPFVPVEDYDGPGRSAAEEGEATYFWTVNYGKKSVELDLKTEAGRQALYDLVAEADVFVENFRPGITDRLGVDYETLRDVNDRLVYCSMSAFGETGPWRNRPGYDLLIQGMSGIMSVTGYPDRPPVKVGLPQTDLIAAMWGAFGVVTALYRRERTGEGERVELGMLDAVLPWLTKQAGKAFVGEEPERMGTKDPVIAPYQTFPTVDGFINVACGSQRLWEQLCEALDREDLLEDERFSSNPKRVEHQSALEDELSAVFETRPTEEWVDLLAGEHDLPVGPVYDVAEALDNEQVAARGVVGSLHHEAYGEVPTIDHPLNFDRAESGFDSPPPLLGEHTDAVLASIGYDAARIEELREAGAIPSREESSTQ